jgi:hypothetical protein
MIDLNWQALLKTCQIKIADLEDKIMSQRWKVQRLLKQQMNAACAQRVLAFREESLGRVQSYKFLIEARIAASAADKPRAAGHGSATSPAAQQPSSPPTDVLRSLKGSKPSISKSGPHKPGRAGYW